MVPVFVLEGNGDGLAQVDEFLRYSHAIVLEIHLALPPAAGRRYSATASYMISFETDRSSTSAREQLSVAIARPVTRVQAVGQYRQNFHVVIAGSNGYDKTLFQQAEQVSGYNAAVNITNQAITKARAYYLGSEFFAGPYDATLCGYYATAQTAANKQYAKQNGLKTYQAANSFNAYYVYKNAYARGTYCNLYKQEVDASYAGSADTTTGGNSYTVGSSWVYNASPQDPGTL
ncbi:Hypothetical predicted protein [Lecanosticta acicola]|uniref:Uncharacterized protein n=1 Tax=Lecanosticta acicola TaxID=111012 RepID=A0AAI8Z944_9PEZI|nr:Hypothetical predicted protein [Lecanosticta acicola]